MFATYRNSGRVKTIMKIMIKKSLNALEIQSTAFVQMTQSLQSAWKVSLKLL